MDFIFVNKPEFAEPIRVLFLCGVKFKDTETDKRIILKDYLERDSKNKVVILEKYFSFAFKKSDERNFLSYYDARLFNLHNIEAFAALASTNVVIIHESLSTAGELGVFGSNKELRDRIITLAPDRFCVEEEKISGFLNLAFWNHKERLLNNNVLRFYPKTVQTMVSETHSFYETYFGDNELPDSLGREIEKQIIKEPRSELIAIGASNVRKQERGIEVALTCSAVKNYLLAVLSVKEVRGKVRACKRVCDIQNVLKHTFIETLKNTYHSFCGIKPQSVSVVIKDQPGLLFEDAVSFMIYLYHACGLITITCKEDKTTSVGFPKNNSRLWRVYSKLMKPIDFAKWGD